MKTLLISLLFFPVLSFSNPFEGSHWTLKKITCASGSPTLDLEKAGVRYDMFFLENKKYETTILRQKDWTVVRGVIEFKSDTQVCLNSQELIMSGESVREWKKSSCVNYAVSENTLNFSWVITSPGGGDCPQNDPVTSHFERLN